MTVWGVDLGVRSVHLARLDGADLYVRSIRLDRQERWAEMTRLFLELGTPFKSADLLFIEEPPLVRSSRVHGEMHQVAGAVMFTAVPAHTYLVNVMTWKKDLVGFGNASKTQVGQWLKDHYPRYSAICAEDQDLIDATCIALYGQQVLGRP